MGVIVPKKTAKKAVERNRIRRRLLSAGKEAGFPVFSQKAFRIVAIGNRRVLDADFSELIQSLKRAFGKVEKIK
jgi:ribonuclease P protein component